MKNTNRKLKPSKPAPIKTTFMELLDELSSITQDDALVMATMKNIFSSYKIRVARTLAPVRLESGEQTLRALRRGNLGRRSSAWA
jgi:hypothetical protein